MDWRKGFGAACYVKTVDPSTWRDINRIEITGGSISKISSELRESADIDCVNYAGKTEQWIRVYLDAFQEGDSKHEALFTGLACVPSVDRDGAMRRCQIECYSVLKPAQDVLLQRGWYAPEGMDGAELVKTLLATTPAPIEVEKGSAALLEPIVAEDGESCLSMACKILNVIGWRIRIGGDGMITVCPKASAVSAIFDPEENDVVEPKITTSSDWYGCPNVFRAVNHGVAAIARDDDEDSIFSTVSRGREIWMEEMNCSLNDGETVEEYAMRRLKEEQTRAETISYKRRYNPDVQVGDKVQFRYHGHGIVGEYTVTEQSIDLSYPAKISEKSVK